MLRQGDDGVGAFVVVLAIDVKLGLAVVRMKVFLGLRQHAAGAAGRVKEFADSSRAGEQVVVVDEEQVDHEADDVARGEMIAGGLVGQFVEAADEVFEDQPHVGITDAVGMQVHVAELGDSEIEEVGLAQLLDFVGELEILEDAADVGGEAVDVAGEVLFDVIRVAFELLERQGGVIMETLTGGLAEEFVEGLVVELAALPLLVFAEDLFLGRGEDAVEPPENGHGEHDPLVLGRSVGAAQQVGDLPDEVCQFVVVGHSYRDSLFRFLGSDGFFSMPRAWERLIR